MYRGFLCILLASIPHTYLAAAALGQHGIDGHLHEPPILEFRAKHVFCSDLDPSSRSIDLDIRDIDGTAQKLHHGSDTEFYGVKLRRQDPILKAQSSPSESSILRGDHAQIRMADGSIIIRPNITDKETVVNLAKMTSDAYIIGPRQPDWLNTSLGFNFTCRFGWKGDGLRGHVFSTEDNSTVVVAFKGTTISPIGDTPAKDRINDNRLFSCCCATQTPYFYGRVCDCRTGYYQCDSNCLTQAVLQNDTYYVAAITLMEQIRERYPHSTFWTVGHSLGGSLASLVGLTYNIPAVTFEAPPERLPAQRMGLLAEDEDMGTGRREMAYHFGNTADPVYMGACNGYFSSCAIGGFSFESQCFSGKRCVYDTVKDKGWHQNINNHRILYVIDNVLEAYDEVPSCEVDDECEECFNWKFS